MGRGETAAYISVGTKKKKGRLDKNPTPNTRDRALAQKSLYPKPKGGRAGGG